MTRQLLTVAAALFAIATRGAAQTVPASPPQAPSQASSQAPSVGGPPIRKIETAQALSTEQLGAITSVRGLPDGRVMLNDAARRRLLLLDTALKVTGVLLDSLTEVQNAYGTRAGALVPYVGDSTLFIDPATLAMLVLDPSGKIARVRSIPRTQDATWISNSSGAYGYPGFDARGRLIYRIPATAAPPAVAPPRGVPYIPSPPDSAFVVAIDLASRKLDTLASVRVPKFVYQIRQSGGDGGFSFTSYSSPLPLVDDWAVLDDGTIALLRGLDYRVEYRRPDGTTTSSEKLPFPWVRLSDEDKTKFMDSIKTIQVRSSRNSYVTNMIVWTNMLNKPPPKDFSVHAGYTLPPGLPRDWILPDSVRFPANYMYGCPPGVAPTAPTSGMVGMAGVAAGMASDMVRASAGAPPVAAGGTAARPPSSTATPPGAPAAPPCIANPYADMYGYGYTPPMPRYQPPGVYPANELPDYKPPIGPIAMRADADGNLWIRPQQMKPAPGGVIYDIVNRNGELADRIQLPPGYTLMGFGRGGVVYLSTRDAKGLHLARVQLRAK